MGYTTATTPMGNFFRRWPQVEPRPQSFTELFSGETAGRSPAKEAASSLPRSRGRRAAGALTPARVQRGAQPSEATPARTPRIPRRKVTAAATLHNLPRRAPRWLPAARAAVRAGTRGGKRDRSGPGAGSQPAAGAGSAGSPGSQAPLAAPPGTAPDAPVTRLT